ncbi:DNA polymerase III subunit gamma/tau [Thiocapsa roseopersicina]|uniref:DNA polymerase III subunit gamma/tau n=1 Tax=Thiocapsa roseopersicina TaxID=1058 RepID=A0A1H2QIE1_THIRO|nr:DNA polymerase III subunit gamma/tau [Thiocapsa roseopersicina]SDW06648.1 DNA polymerase-3 subunit gamma/tau [Thiocapsa roseopersicina]
MSYQVLARKWRPKSFDDLVGQSHVVRALSNALDRDQLHHAYLFTGTRGVGKTTLARILAKALNCEEGVNSRPCGVCSSCREIDGGRFVDLIEVDAASRTKVDQTRELLDNVPYAPARARYKVYLIDEVHMFSNHSFNALLKTLEEPPPHVKFLLATTDPQKVPVTVLSRCLQLNLRRLLPEEIRARLQHVLEAEGLAFQASALPLLARGADGSMRDGLSLLDQAIAFGGGRVEESGVRTMLGTQPGDVILDLLDALAAGDGARVLAEVERVASLTPDFEELLRELIALLHRLALLQQVPETLAPDDPDAVRLKALADRLPAEDLQLYYQVALTGQGDLPLAPDPRAGFEMVLLRALAFRPGSNRDEPPRAPPRPLTLREAATGGATRPAESDGGAVGSPVSSPASSPVSVLRPVAEPRVAEPAPAHHPGSATRAPAEMAGAAGTVVLTSHAEWLQLVDRLDLGGIASQIAHHCDLKGWSDGRLSLGLDPAAEHLRSAGAESRLQAALEKTMGTEVKLDIQVARPQRETLAQRRERETGERRQAAVSAMEEDPIARAMQDELDASWIAGSIEPAD